MQNIQIGIKTNEFGQNSGIAIVNKPKGITSHDVVYKARRKYETKKVGHAGALDPFAEGVLIILVGKSTKLSNEFLNLDKEYEADILFGISTDSADIEGRILETEFKVSLKLNKEDVIKELESFKPSYMQYVPAYSSVKVDGNKLRKLAREFEHKVIYKNNKKVLELFKNNKLYKEIPIPQKEVQIYSIELISLQQKTLKQIKNEYDFEIKVKDSPSKFNIAKVKIKCSKGTYIRSLAEDIGEKLNTKSMLVALKRTAVGDFKIKDSIEL